jgi:hypothetical protein
MPKNPLVFLGKNSKQSLEFLPSLQQLAESAGARFHGSGPNPASHCPLHHGDNPNAFHLYDHGTRWHCFTRCPPGQNDGNALHFYQLWTGKKYPETDIVDHGVINNINLKKNVWQERAESFLTYARHNLTHPTLGEKARRYLLQQRGLQPPTWDLFNLGFNPTDLANSPARWGLENGKKVFLPRGLVIPRYFRGQLLGLKIRRPRPDDPLASVFLSKSSQESVQIHSSVRIPKYISVRGSLHGLFASDTWLGYPDLLLVEGEWDCLLAWQQIGHLCDVATFGSASSGLSEPEEIALYAYRRIFIVFDADPAGQAGLCRFNTIARLHPIPPPAHDLTDYWLSGGDLPSWFSGYLKQKDEK